MRILALLFFAFLADFSALLAQNYTVEKLPDFINSPADEITPVLSRDGRTLYFTRVGFPDFDHTIQWDTINWATKLQPEAYRTFLAGIYSEISGMQVLDPVHSSFNQDIWIATGDSAAFTAISHPGPPLNNALPNSLVSITPDPNAFYIINQFTKEGDMDRGFSLIRRTTDSVGWTFPVPVEIKDFYTITSDVSLTMSFDGKVLILSAVRFDSRDMDLYVCFKEGDNKWTAPLNLGSTINSIRRETTPFLSEDNTTLYFSSNRGESSGGNDIFVSKRLDETWQNWTQPERLPEPINSRSDESQPYFNMTSGYLYFTSRRAGNSDIFKAQIAPPQPTELLVKGRILNRKTGELMTGTRIYYGAADNVPNTLSTPDGTFSLKIPRGVVFNLTPEKTGFTGDITNILLRRNYYYFREQYVELWLNPLEVNAQIELRPIFFQQSKAIILEESYPELERLAVLLRETPSLQIRVEGHTDNIGREEDLQQLSKDRAVAIRNFLIDKGIDPVRILAVGLGAKYPLNSNESDEQRSKNRRVEVRVAKI